MPIRAAIVLVLLFSVLVAYLTSPNTGRVSLALTSESAYDLPLMAVVVGVFLGGARLTFVFTTLRDLTRSYRGYRQRRRARRAESVNETYQRGLDAQLAGKSDVATRAYEELLQREPAHADAHVRLGELARQRGDAPAALSHYLEALRSAERPDTLLAVADEYRRSGRPDDAIAMYQGILTRDRDHVKALQGLRDLTASVGRWAEALEVQERLVQLVPAEGRASEEAWRAGILYEIGSALLADGQVSAALTRLRETLRSAADFLPATLALGDAHLKAGDSREALRVWERGLETQLALPLLGRIEEVHRAEGRPTRMIALYQAAAARAPDNLALAFGLGRVFFELAMLDEAADQFEKIEVRAAELTPVHAHLGAIFERRGQLREACEEYRRALRLSEAFEWPHRCSACGAEHPGWVARCSSCRRWNTSRP